MLRKLLFFFLIALVAGIVCYRPAAISEPAANPQDPAQEDLTRVHYLSLDRIPWRPRFIQPQDSMESLYGKDWLTVARFNRIDRRHVYPGMTIKEPVDIESAKEYTPMPSTYFPAKHHDKYILINLTEQWLGAYEFGKLKFSMPVASGMQGYETPVGLFQVDARHRNHTSSLYKTEDQSEQYPMDNAFRFHIGEDNVSYWIHARDLPGRPASHGCVGVSDEFMQNRIYGFPETPVVRDSEKLYEWAVGEEEYEDDAGNFEDTGDLEELEGGPVVEVIGANPEYRN